MLDKLKSLLKSDDLLPSLSLFPEIDQEKLRHELGLEREGEQRGKRNFPASGTSTPDNIETSIITRIEGLRRKGLENYENNVCAGSAPLILRVFYCGCSLQKER